MAGHPRSEATPRPFCTSPKEIMQRLYQRRKYTNDKHYSVEVQRVSIKKKKHTYEVRHQVSVLKGFSLTFVQDSYSEKAPKGYHYLPVGYRRIKEFCREQCLKYDRIYYVVSVGISDLWH